MQWLREVKNKNKREEEDAKKRESVKRHTMSSCGRGKISKRRKTECGAAWIRIQHRLRGGDRASHHQQPAHRRAPLGGVTSVVPGRVRVGGQLRANGSVYGGGRVVGGRGKTSEKLYTF